MTTRQLATDASTWKGPEMAASMEWLEPLTEDEIADLDQALGVLR